MRSQSARHSHEHRSPSFGEIQPHENPVTDPCPRVFHGLYVPDETQFQALFVAVPRFGNRYRLALISQCPQQSEQVVVLAFDPVGATIPNKAT